MPSTPAPEPLASDLPIRDITAEVAELAEWQADPRKLHDAWSCGPRRRYFGLRLSPVGEDGETLVTYGRHHWLRMYLAAAAWDREMNGRHLVRLWKNRSTFQPRWRQRGLFTGMGRNRLAVAREHIGVAWAQVVRGCPYADVPDLDDPDAYMPEEATEIRRDHPDGACCCDGPWLTWTRRGQHHLDSTHLVTTVDYL